MLMKSIVCSTMSVILHLFFVVFVPHVSARQLDEETLDGTISSIMLLDRVPALAACIVQDNDTLWNKAYGYADVHARIPASTDTLFMLASVSKTVTAAAVMHVYEQGLFDLDDDINEHLPFSVRNPDFPDTPITFRMLLAHTSSLSDRFPFYLFQYSPGDPRVKLADFLKDYFMPSGAYYSIDNFTTHTPGTDYEYSNYGYALLGYLVESITGQDFNDYCTENIFLPLGMTETSWFLEGLNVSHIARPYAHVPVIGYLPYPHYNYPDYPSGSVRTSVTRLSQFLRCFMNGGSYNGVRLLSEETVNEMFTLHYPQAGSDHGLCWVQYDIGGVAYWGHSGGDPGVSTAFFFRPSDNFGFIILTNADVSEWAYNRLISLLITTVDAL